MTAFPIFSMSRAISALMLREVATSYGRSPGGFVWAVAEPVAAIALLTAVFSVVFDRPSLGFSFALFYATGFLPFMMFNDTVNKVAAAIRFSRPLLAYPVVTVLDALLGRFFLNLLVHALIVSIMLFSIEALFVTGALYDPADLVVALAMAVSLALGIGTLNCYLGARFPVWERVWQIGTRPLFIVSGIFFVLEDLPAGLRDTAWWNPLIHVTALMRAGTYPYYEGTWISPAFVFGTALAAFVLGLVLLRQTGRDILNS
ncbi:MAG: ABC transporter permease [Pseudomonadota bacterium]